MLIELFPRAHARYLSLPLLGPLLDGLARWLVRRGYSASAIRARIRRAPVLETLLLDRGLQDLAKICRSRLLELTARKSQADIRLSALVRSLADFLEERGILAAPPRMPGECLADTYCAHLKQVRGLARSTRREHRRVALDLLAFVGFDSNQAALAALDGPRVEAFVPHLASGCGLSRFQLRASFLRSFLRFLAGRDEVSVGLDLWVHSPRAPRRAELPRALPWQTVRDFLGGIDRDTPKGRRDYAMFLLIATYGLRISEVAALQLDDIRWRSAKFHVQRPKALAPLCLPLTDATGAALADYLRHARPSTTQRAVFLRVRQPVGPLSTGGIQGAFSHWLRSGLPDFEGSVGPHCLRHSLATHLLRRNASVKVIGDLLGHRSLASTQVYLQLHEEDLRAAALDLPAGREGRP